MNLKSLRERFDKWRLEVWVPRARERHLAAKKRRLRNDAPTIISRDCLGARIYHALGLRFNSPTINLFVSHEDFLKLVRNLEGYMRSEVYELKLPHVTYPVGRISCDGDDVILHFMHYGSFGAARHKWHERKQRIDYSNIYVMSVCPQATAEYVREFDELPCKHKMLLTGVNPCGSPNVVELPVFRKADYRPGEVLEYKNDYADRRYMDDVDYVSFLNRKQ